jgi:sporulation protein YlmC with PRC-barrel domain
MFRSVERLTRFNVVAQDGEFGEVTDVLFDDQEWTVRYIVVDTGKFLPGRKVIIPPQVIEDVDWEGKLLPIGLTKQQIKSSPSLDADAPVSRRHEIELHRFFHWEPYWIGGPLSGAVPSSLRQQDPTMFEDEDDDKIVEKVGPEHEPNEHLRSVREVRGYRITSTDGDIGHVDDFLLDDGTWIIRYLAIDTRDWLPGKRVLIHVPWVTEVSWGSSRVSVDLSKEKIKDSPEYKGAEETDRGYERMLFEYYARPHYWLDKSR